MSFLTSPYRFAAAGLTFLGGMTAERSNAISDGTALFSNLRDTTGGTVTLQPGDLIVACHCASSTGGSSQDVFKANLKDASYSDALTDAFGIYSSDPDTTLFVSYKFMGATPDTSMVVKNGTWDSSASHAVAIFAFRGAHATPFEATYTTATATSTSIDPPAITPSTAGCIILVVGGVCDSTASVPTLPADLSADTNKWQSIRSADSNDACIGAGMKEGWTSGSFNPTSWAAGVGTAAPWTWASVSLVLKPA